MPLRGPDLWREFRERAVTLSMTDTLAAAVALEQGAVLLTDNMRDFPVDGLPVVSLRS